MKYFIPFIALVFSLTLVSGQSASPASYSIKGQIRNWNERYIYFSCKGNGENRLWDSAIVKNNAFYFTGTLGEPSNRFFTILKFDRVKNTDDKNITRRFFISPSKMTISLELDSFHNAKLLGSEYQTQFEKLEYSKKKFYDEIASLNKRSDSLVSIFLKTTRPENQESENKALQAKLVSILATIDSLQEKCFTIDKAFFARNPSSVVTAYLMKYAYKRFSLKELKSYYSRVPPAMKQWEYGAELKDAIAALQSASPASLAADFKALDINGDSLSLSQFKGKFVLLDFWASWCVPCRAGNPALIRLYNKYKSKGIEFIGIADDIGTEDKWRSAVEKDSVNIWRHILNNRILDIYAVHFLPTQILIDPKGMILARFGDGGEPTENISKALEKIFGQ